MPTKAEIESRIADLKRELGDWTYDIPLGEGVWTRGNQNIPHTRLKRILQIATDLCSKPLSQCRVLDLGCLDGLFSIEFASHGAQTVGVEIREANIRKAQFCKEVLGLDNLTFVQDDVQNISRDALGEFDVIVCSGILYHLTGRDAIRLIETMYALVTELLIVDTRITADAVEHVHHGNSAYWGEVAHEHAPSDTQEQKAKKLLSSWDNEQSFYFTRPSLVNLLSSTGFSSVYECFMPPHINYGKPGIESRVRCTFVARKNQRQQVVTSPAANELEECWPEDTLSYAPAPKGLRKLNEKIKPSHAH